MKIGDYIIAEDWNSLTDEEYLGFCNYLKLLGHNPDEEDDTVIARTVADRKIVVLDVDGALWPYYRMPGHVGKCVELADVRRMAALGRYHEDR